LIKIEQKRTKWKWFVTPVPLGAEHLDLSHLPFAFLALHSLRYCPGIVVFRIYRSVIVLPDTVQELQLTRRIGWLVPDLIVFPVMVSYWEFITYIGVFEPAVCVMTLFLITE
jgi:hypothetical protein